MTAPVSDESKGQWVRCTSDCIRWTGDGAVHVGAGSLSSLSGYPDAARALVALIERDAVREQPLPTMVGWEIEAAWARGEVVERHVTESHGGGSCWEVFTDAPYNRDAMPVLNCSVFVARVVPPPEPETERVPLAFVKGRTLPDGTTLEGAAQATNVPASWFGYRDDGRGGVPLTIDADGMVEVLARSSMDSEQQQ